MLYSEYDNNNNNTNNNDTQNDFNYYVNNAYTGEPEIRLTREQIITIGECPTRLIPDPPAKYAGKFLGKTESNMLILGVCAEKIKNDIDYNPGNYIAVSYILLRSLYSFNAQIVNIREAVEEDRFDTGDMLNELTSVYGYKNYIFEVMPQTSPEKQQRREFFRMPLKIDVYYRLISKIDFENIKVKDLKLEPEKAKKIKSDADDGLLETEKGYLKLSTTDISAGGFRCRHHIGIDVNTYLDCMLIINGEALPVIARIVGLTGLHSQSGGLNSRLYDVRASFDKINDSVRNKLVKYIFYQQRQLQAKFLKRRF